MRLYWEVARTTARRMTTYRMATLAGIFTNTVFGFILSYVLLAVFRERGTIGGFDAVDAVTYTFVAQGLAMPVGIFGNDLEQSQRILTGEVAMDLCRPYDYQGWWAAVAFGKASFLAWARGIPPFVVGALVLDVRVPTEWWIWPAFVVAATFAIAVAFAVRFLVQLSAFWILDVRGPNQVVWIAAGFLSGMFVPIVLLPDAVEAVVRLLPFAAMVNVPIEVFLGRHHGVDLFAAYLGQIAWLVATVVVGRLVLARAVRKLVVLGG